MSYRTWTSPNGVVHTQPEHGPCATCGKGPHPDADPQPVTYQAACAWTLTEARDRYDELVDRDLSARAAASLRASGKFDPADRGHQLVAEAAPLAADEHLELVALGERLARHYSHPVLADRALEAGATWQQVATARGTSIKDAQADHAAWAWRHRDLEAGS